MTSSDYLVEMTFAPFTTLLTPEQMTTFAERFVLPTLDACQRLIAAGRIVAGGTALAAVGFIFIARAETPQELEDMVAGLPLWARAQTRVVPLGSFSARAATVRQRFNQINSTSLPAFAPSPVLSATP